MKSVVGFVAGMIFALGLGIAGMTQPSKVLGFLDLSSAWDPSLAFVMIGAISVYSFGYYLTRRNGRPMLDDKFHVPDSAPLDARLLVGAAVFGIGWGLGGYCPGPAVVSLAHGARTTIAFVVAMLAAMAIYAIVESRRAKASARNP